MSDPFVLGLESTRTECAEEGEVFLRFSRAINTVELGSIIVG